MSQVPENSGAAVRNSSRSDLRIGNRVDPPHPATGLPLERPAVVSRESAAGEPPSDHLAEAWEQLERQTEELAEYLQQRQQALDRREAELDQRARRLAAEEASAAKRFERLAEDITRREQACAAASERFAGRAAANSETRHQPQTAAAKAPREDFSSASAEQLERMRAELAAQQAAWREQQQREQRELEQAQQQHRARVARDLARLARRHATLETLRERLQRLCGELAGRALDARVNAPAMDSGTPNELRKLATQLAAQREALRRQVRQQRHWLTRRQSELESQAAKLIARKYQLDEQTRLHPTERVSTEAAATQRDD